jgi:DNA polymerase-3 subunit epsilon
VSEAEYAALVERVVRGLTDQPRTLLDPLEARMRDLAAAERFEEAADARNRAAALARALSRHRRLDSLRQAGRVELEVDGDHVVLAGGTLAAGPGMLALVPHDIPGESAAGETATGETAAGATTAAAAAAVAATAAATASPANHSPLPRDLVDEVACVAAWLDAEGRAARLVSCEGAWTSPLPVLPGYEPAGRPDTRRAR